MINYSQLMDYVLPGDVIESLGGQTGSPNMGAGTRFTVIDVSIQEKYNLFYAAVFQRDGLNAGASLRAGNFFVYHRQHWDVLQKLRLAGESDSNFHQRILNMIHNQEIIL